jgi:starch-binding outer membrane protein, SusD/RagB family
MKRIIFPIIIALICMSCEDILERIETASENEAVVFSDRIKTERALNHLYSCMRFNDGYAVFTGQGGRAVMDVATDNAWAFGIYDGASHFNFSTMTPNQNAFINNVPWRNFYAAIRSANIFLKNIDKSPLTAQEKADMKVEGRFLRAIYYSELFIMYGGLVIMGDDVATNVSFEGYRRSDIEETVDYIVGEFDAVIPNLRTESQWGPTEYGRATKGMAMSYKARVLLYYASPLNTQGVGQAEIQQRWSNAANAAKEVINSGYYELHPDYMEFFYTRQNSEIILSYLRGRGIEAYTTSLPSIFLRGTTITGARPTFNAVDGHAMIDGKVPVLGYDGSGNPIYNPEATSYDPSKPFENRDPRLKYNILKHGDTLLINGVPTPLNMRELYASSGEGLNSFFFRKYMDPNFNHYGSGNLDQNYPIIRYADILLIFAEASNQANGPNAEAIQVINQVRTRAGALPLNTNGWTRESLNEQIVVERRMEFFAEEHRFWDAKRWLRGEEFLGANIIGGIIVDGQYERFVWGKKIFLPKLYRLPIPTGDVFNSGGRIEQNPGW